MSKPLSWTLTETEKRQAADDLKRFYGLPPYRDGSNFCWGDGYFAKSIEHKYAMSIERLSKATGVVSDGKTFMDVFGMVDHW